MGSDNDRNAVTAPSTRGFRQGEQQVPAESSTPSREDAMQMQMHEIEAQLCALETQNAELLQAISETEKSLRRYHDLFDHAPVGGVILGSDGIICTINHRGAQILGCGSTEVVGRRLEQFIPDSSRPRFKEFFGNMLGEKRKANCEMAFSPRGNRLLIRLEGVYDVPDDECRVAMIDMTDPAHNVQEEMNDSLRQQRKLSTHLMSRREEERAAVAREINENLGQMLATLQLNVSLLALKYPDHGELVARATAMEQLIASSIMTVQRISSELRPVMLDILGLADAVEWQAKEFQKTSGIACRAIILLKKKHVDGDMTTAVFRVFQEALSNVVRHAGATSVEATLVEKNGWLTLSVHDNGRGITEKEKRNPHSLGIAGMRERVAACGGKLRICGSPQHGTSLFARIPLRREERHAHQDTGSR